MPSVTYEDYPEARLIIIWGANPSASGIHLVPYIRDAQRNGATLIVIDPRTTALAKQADIHLAIKPGTDLPVALVDPSLPVRGGLRRSRVPRRRTHATPRSCAPRRSNGRSNAPRPKPASPPNRLNWRSRALRGGHPALIRCGWGQERNRNGGNSSLAILALPAVAGKFGVRGGGYAMSNTAAWGIERTWIGAPEPRLARRQHEPARTCAHRTRSTGSTCCSSTTRTRRSRHRINGGSFAGWSARISSPSSSNR